MSSDRQDPGSTWQGPTNADINQAANHAPIMEPEEPAPFPAQQQTGAYYPGTPIPQGAAQGPDALEPLDDVQDPNDYDDQAEPGSTLTNLLQRFGQYLACVLVPVLFGGLTCLFVLPAIASRRAYLPPQGFWPIVLVIIAITIAQGVAIYYAGSDNGKWALGTIGGFFLFLLLGCLAIFGLIPFALLFVALITISIVLARRCIHPVPEGYADIIFSAKKYSRTFYPGFNLLFPWEEVAAQLNVAEAQWLCPAQNVQLSPDEDVILRAVISYQLLPEDAHLAVTQVNNWEVSLRELFIATLQTIATVFKPEDFLPWQHDLQARQAHQSANQSEDDFRGGLERRERINSYLFQSMRDKVALWGVQINWVIIRDVELAPHGVVVIDTPAAPVAAQPAAANAAPEVATVAQAAQQPVHLPAPSNASVPKHPETTVLVQPPAAPAPQLLKEEFLIKIYKEVQDGHITDPETIRDFATKFELVAQDPEACQTVSFDAARAALNLYEQARKYEEQHSRMYEDATRPDWKVAPPRS